LEVPWGQSKFGRNVKLVVHLSNPGATSRVVDVDVNVGAIFYTGRPAGVIDDMHKMVKVPAARTKTVEFVVGSAK
jgi:hypothetical protein